MTIAGEAYILWALLLLVVPLNWLLAGAVAAAFHEACHALAVLACGGRVLALKLTWAGARMEVSPLGRWQRLICSLAGPAGSILLILLAPWMPRVALCGLGQGAFNLLPIYPLDGGRAMVSLIPTWRQHGEGIALWLLLALTLWGAVFRNWGWLFPGMVASAIVRRKKPCKSRRFRVQ